MTIFVVPGLAGATGLANVNSCTALVHSEVYLVCMCSKYDAISFVVSIHCSGFLSPLKSLMLPLSDSSQPSNLVSLYLLFLKFARLLFR